MPVEISSAEREPMEGKAPDDQRSFPDENRSLPDTKNAAYAEYAYEVETDDEEETKAHRTTRAT